MMFQGYWYDNHIHSVCNFALLCNARNLLTCFWQLVQKEAQYRFSSPICVIPLHWKWHNVKFAFIWKWSNVFGFYFGRFSFIWYKHKRYGNSNSISPNEKEKIKTTVTSFHRCDSVTVKCDSVTRLSVPKKVL